MQQGPVTGYAMSPDGSHMVLVAEGRFRLPPITGHRDPRLVCKSKGDWTFLESCKWPAAGGAFAFAVAAAGLRWIDRPEPTDMER